FLMSIDGAPMIYYGDEIGMTGAGDPDNRRDMRFGDQLSADEKRVFENFKKLGAIRRAHSALRYGSRRTLAADHDLYAFVRAHLNERADSISSQDDHLSLSALLGIFQPLASGAAAKNCRDSSSPKRTPFRLEVARAGAGEATKSVTRAHPRTCRADTQRGRGF